MEITGRLTADAKTSTVKDGRQVVNFSIAINDKYKTKASEEVIKVTTYVNCSYWLNADLVQYLSKATIVQLYGRISVNAWTNAEGEAKASLNFHVNNLKILNKPKTDSEMVSHNEGAAKDSEDLPF